MAADKSSEDTRTDFARFVAEGKPYASDVPVEVRGEDLRDLLLAWGTYWARREETPGSGAAAGAKASGHAHLSPMPAVITPAGVIIDGGKRATITIVGECSDSPGASARAQKIIDLTYLAGRSGSPLPRLVIRNCRIDGELRLTGSHFSFLSLENCRISRINADHCQIDNQCRLTDLRSATDGGRGLAQVRMLGARIGGSLNLRGSRLRAPRPQRGDDPRQFADRYALSLASSEISGRLHLTNGFVALGGISLYQATIRHSVSFEGARLRSHAALSRSALPVTGQEDSSRKQDLRKVALDAEELKLSGSFLWANENTAKTRDDHDGADIIGQIVLRRARIGGDCKFEHCRWGGDDAGQDNPGRFHGGIDARLVRISGQFRIGEGCCVARWDEPPARRQAKDAVSGDCGASIDAWKALIGKGVRIEERSTFLGPIFMNDTRIEHGFIMRGEMRGPLAEGPASKVPEGLDLSEARISGRVVIDSDISGAVSLRRARVDGTVEVNRLVMTSPRLMPATELGDRETGIATILDLSSATIADALHLGVLDLKWTGTGAAAARTRPIIVDLRGLSCRIFDDNEAQVWVGLGDQQHWRLLLDGITFASFDQSNPRHRSKPKSTSKQQTPAAESGDGPASVLADSQPGEARMVLGRTDMLKAFAPPSAGGRWSRLLANVVCARLEEYSPQPYETFARAYFRDGKRKEGLTTAKERATLRWCRSAYRWSAYNKANFAFFSVLCVGAALIFAILMNIDNKDSFLESSFRFFTGRTWHPPSEPFLSILAIGARWLFLSLAFIATLFFSPYLVLLTGWLFKAGFNYGFNPGRACVTLLGSLLLGIIAANNVALHPLSHLTHAGGGAGYPVRIASTERIAVEGCNLAGANRVDRALYAVDVFVPLIDLHGECAFFVAEKDKYLRLAIAFYAGLGWLVVSLTLLTFSGILRRDLEV